MRWRSGRRRRGSRLKRNFQIDPGFGGVIAEPAHIDLHNLYEAADVSTDARGETLTIRFVRDHRWEGPPDQPELVTLRCSGDLRVAFTNLAGRAALVDEFGFEIAYFAEDCDWREFLDEELAERQGFAGLHVGFGDGLVVRIRCAEAEITTEDR